jgi:aspartate/tyrosine/aromatic aminotransferase
MKFLLQAKHVAVLEKKWHIYCTKNGRFSMAGVNLNNASYIANAMKDALASEGSSAV